MDHEAIKKSKAALYVIFKWQSTGYYVYAGLTCVKIIRNSHKCLQMSGLSLKGYARNF